MATKGFLLVLMQPPAGMDEEFNAWYDSEHIPERAAVPGFLSSRRFVCLDGHPRYLALYDLAGPEVLETPAYRKVAYENSSPWSKRVTSRVRIYRSAGRQVLEASGVTKPNLSRLTLLRFRGLKAEAQSQIIAGVRTNYETRAETLQARVMAYETSAGIDYLAVIESRAPFGEGVSLQVFGAYADALDLVNTYAPY
jgi:hypothetical protein